MYEIRKWRTIIEEINTNERGITDGDPVKKAAVLAVIKNPYAGTYSDDLSQIVDPSAVLGASFGERLLTAMGGTPIQSYGKSAIVGVAGEYEHGNAFLASAFANPIREALGGGAAWVPSTGKVSTMGTEIDVPLACKDALYVRSHYDTLTVSVPDGPAPDEVVVIVAVSSRGRLKARLGGLAYEDVQGEDGLR